MGEVSKKQYSTSKGCSQSPPQEDKIANQNMKRIGVVCGIAAVAVCAWYVLSSEPAGPNIAEVTRPPEGFEASAEAAESPVDFSGQRVPDEAKSEPLTTSDREQELLSLLSEKELLISELTRQLEESQQQNEQAVVPVEETPSTPQTEPQDRRVHTVQRGETLSEIARHYYGTSNRWQRIYEANQETLSDKNRLRVGTVLIIPD